MARRLPQRQFALLGIALLAAAVSLAVSEKTHEHAAASLPKPAGSYSALAGSSGTATVGKKTACGVFVRPTTEGVTNPVLPCGVRLYVGFRGKHVLVTVIGHGPTAAGQQFGLTTALAKVLGLEGVQRINWSYAGAG